MSNDLTLRQETGNILLDARMDAQKYPRLKTYPKEQAVAIMSQIVAKAFMYRGQQADPVNVNFISSSLVDELLLDSKGYGTKMLSFAEIGQVIKDAVLGTEMYGISVASLYKVLFDYAKGEGHRLDQEARKRANPQISIRESVVQPMLQAYAGAMMKNNKI